METINEHEIDGLIQTMRETGIKPHDGKGVDTTN